MFVTCKDILSLPAFKTSTVAAGVPGLNRIISWLYIAECLDNPLQSVDWIDGGELVYITGAALKRNKIKLIDFISKINDKNASGLLVNIGEFFSKIPEEALKIANELSLPIIEVPWNIKLLDISQEVSNAIILKKLEKSSADNLLEGILFGSLEEEDFIRNAKHYDYDSSDVHRILQINFDNLPTYVESNEATSNREASSILNELQNIVYDTFTKSNQKLITMQKNNSIILMLKANELDTKLITYFLGNVEKRIQNKFPSFIFKVGIGNTYNKIKDMQKSHKEAEKAIKIANCDNTPFQAVFYEQPSIYNLLLNIEDKSLFHTFTNSIIDPLLQYDKINKSDLFFTLENYLEENCNIISTSNKLFVHKNTLKYRIQKIEKILDCDLNDLNACTNLNLAMKMYKLLQIKI
jgi:DNA-binding PucR family transcriptional regulator